MSETESNIPFADESREIAEIRAKGYRVLVVDDEPNIVRLIKVDMERHGYIVETASNGAAALTKIKENRPDCLITDDLMPELEGPALIKALRSEKSLADLPVLLVMCKSPRSRFDEVMKYVHSDADRFIMKPFNPAELVFIVTQMLRPRRKESN